MITIPIYIFDSSKKDKVQKLIDENDTLGFEKNKIDKEDLITKYSIVDFHIDERQFQGFWVDPGRDDDTKTFDIVLYICGMAFRTPYSNETEAILVGLLNSKR